MDKEYKTKQTIRILGSKWTVFFLNEEAFGALELDACDGATDPSDRKIFILVKDYDCINPDRYVRQICRHEIIHAFMQESGLSDSWEHPLHGHDETTVDWFALQMPKIQKACRKLGCL